MAAAGDNINGFTLVRQLGAGGMGETWEGVRLVGADFEQRVAIKIADRDSLQTPEGLELFRREASLAASLRHPNIAAVIDADERLGCIICELVDGADLRAVLRVSPRGQLSPPVLVYLLSQVSRGLSHAHRRVLHGKLSPVVHRDMSPGNVVVDYDGNSKIVDFGIAKAIASADISETIKGKLSYMAPEQAMGTRVDGRVDQYALAVMAYEALAGVRPNDGAHDGETLANILSGKHIPISMRGRDLPPGLADVIERMLSVSPDQRYPSMDAVIEALDPLTPPLTVHRELAELVLRARPAQTIVMQNGVFVSRPVAHEVVQREPTPKGGRVRSDRPPPLPGASAAPKPMFGPATDPLAPREMSVRTHTQPAMNSPQPRTSLPLPLPLQEDDSDASLRESGAMGGGVRWQPLLAAVGALVLGGLSWFFFAGDAGTTPPPGGTTVQSTAKQAPTLAPNVPPPSQPSPTLPTAVAPPQPSEPPPSAREVATGAAVRSGPAEASEMKVAAEVKPRRVARERDRDRDKVSEKDEVKDNDEVKDKVKASEKDKGTEVAAAKPKGTAVARVKVFPWGRVWVDGKLQGSVPPILEVNLPPGAHEIAVGHERPMESRNVTLQAGTTQLVSFDLEGR